MLTRAKAFEKIKVVLPNVGSIIIASSTCWRVVEIDLVEYLEGMCQCARLCDTVLVNIVQHGSNLVVFICLSVVCAYEIFRV